MNRQSRLLPVLALTISALAIALWWFIGLQGGANRLRILDTAAAMTAGDAAVGYQVIVNAGCGACHQIPGIPFARGLVGPSLEDFGKRAMIGGVLANSAENLVRWLQDPPAVDSQTAMPNLGLSAEQARDVAAYLYDH